MIEQIRLFVDMDKIDLQSAYEEWLWLLGDFNYGVIAISCFGDWFVQSSDGKVHMIDATAAEFRRVADNVDEFRSLLGSIETRDEYFFASFIKYLVMEEKLVLQPNEIYAFKHPLFLGGKVEPANVQVIDFIVANSFHSQLFEQVKDIPDGAEIQIKMT